MATLDIYLADDCKVAVEWFTILTVTAEATGVVAEATVLLPTPHISGIHTVKHLEALIQLNRVKSHYWNHQNYRLKN